MKTRYTIIEPGPLRVEDLYKLTWHDVELKVLSNRGVQNPRFLDVDVYDLRPVLAQHFPGAVERVHVNGFKGPADMFVGERSAMGERIYKNDGATLIYWTATAMHWIAKNEGQSPTYAEMQRRAVMIAADALNGTGAMVRELREETPRIYGRAVLFDQEVWT